MTSTYARLCDACVHVALGGDYADDIAAAMGADFVSGRHAALDALGTITSDLRTAPRLNHVLTPCSACGVRVNDTTLVDCVESVTRRYAVTTNHLDAREPYATTVTYREAMRRALELHDIRTANGATNGAVLIRDTDWADGGAFVYRLNDDGTSTTGVL